MGKHAPGRKIICKAGYKHAIYLDIPITPDIARKVLFACNLNIRLDTEFYFFSSSFSYEIFSSM